MLERTKSTVDLDDPIETNKRKKLAPVHLLVERRHFSGEYYKQRNCDPTLDKQTAVFCTSGTGLVMPSFKLTVDKTDPRIQLASDLGPDSRSPFHRLSRSSYGIQGSITSKIPKQTVYGTGIGEVGNGVACALGRGPSPMWHEFQDTKCAVGGTKHWHRKTKELASIKDTVSPSRPSTTMGFRDREEEGSLSNLLSTCTVGKDRLYPFPEEGQAISSTISKYGTSNNSNRNKNKDNDMQEFNEHRAKLMTFVGYDDKFRQKELNKYDMIKTGPVTKQYRPSTSASNTRLNDITRMFPIVSPPKKALSPLALAHRNSQIAIS